MSAVLPSGADQLGLDTNEWAWAWAWSCIPVWGNYWIW